MTQTYAAPTDDVASCPVRAAMDVVGGKWKPLILLNLLTGAKRFGELRRLIPDASQRMLTKALRELEHDAIITRTVHAEVPPRVDYALTPLGFSLDPLLRQMLAWGQHYRAATTDAAPSPK